MAYLMDHARQKQQKIFLQFGGQGTTYLRELTTLYRDYPELQPFFESVFNTLDEGLRYLKPQKSILPAGFDLKGWLDGQAVPDSSYLGICTVALSGVHITQSAYYHLLTLHGHEPNLLLPEISGMTGHSMGFHSAHLAALGLTGDAYFKALRKFILFVLIGGYRCQEVFPIRDLPESLLEASRQYDQEPPSPMASILGLNRPELQEWVTAFNQRKPDAHPLYISLVNTHESIVLCGYQEDLVAFRAAYYHEMERRETKWTYLEVSAPFHSRILKPAWDAFKKDQEFIQFYYRGSDIKVPVYSTESGQSIESIHDLYQFSFDLMTAAPLSWPASIETILTDEDIGLVADFGPGRFSRSFTKKLLEERRPSLEVVSTANRKTLKQFLS